MKSLAIVVAIFLTVANVISIQEYNDGTMLTKSACTKVFNSCREILTNRRCFNKSQWKRSTRQDDMGPFWANRGKRDPMYTQSRLYVEEPRWEMVRRDEEGNFDPYYAARGKKFYTGKANSDWSRDRRNPHKIYVESESPFLAARGKKSAYTSLI